MLIDSTVFIYETFQRCRHAQPDAGKFLNVLNEVLEKVKQQNSLVIDIANSNWLDFADEYTRERISMSWDLERRLTLTAELPPQSQHLFSLICVGASELQRLWMSESEEAIPAVRTLGYALHNIPGMLRTPERFKREWYGFCIWVVRKYWNQLSPEMKQMFCSVMGLDMEQIVALINSQESD